jgi:hypothetical protein
LTESEFPGVFPNEKQQKKKQQTLSTKKAKFTQPSSRLLTKLKCPPSKYKFMAFKIPNSIQVGCFFFFFFFFFRKTEKSQLGNG